MTGPHKTSPPASDVELSPENLTGGEHHETVLHFEMGAPLPVRPPSTTSSTPIWDAEFAERWQALQQLLERTVERAATATRDDFDLVDDGEAAP